MTNSLDLLLLLIMCRGCMVFSQVCSSSLPQIWPVAPIHIHSPTSHCTVHTQSPTSSLAEPDAGSPIYSSALWPGQPETVRPLHAALPP